jgi:transposase
MEKNRTDDRTEEGRRHSSIAKTKERFVILSQTGRFSVSDLCADFGISRKTCHKYLKRYKSEGLAGLKDRSRRPQYSPNATIESVESLILKERLGEQKGKGGHVGMART